MNRSTARQVTRGGFGISTRFVRHRHARLPSVAASPDPNNESKQVIENEELLIGDVVTLLSFCCLKQIDAIVTARDFPGWTAPLEFRYERWIEFSAFLISTVATYCTVAFLTGGYSRVSSKKLSRLIENCAEVTLITCLLLAAQLVIGVASENATFVGLDGWDDVLPLAARGIGEPYVTGFQLLGISTGWRVIWYFFVDRSSFLSLDRLNARKETERGVLREAVAVATTFAVVSLVFLHLLREAGFPDTY